MVASSLDLVMMDGKTEICRVSFQNEKKFYTLVHLVGFAEEIILRCTAL